MYINKPSLTQQQVGHVRLSEGNVCSDIIAVVSTNITGLYRLNVDVTVFTTLAITCTANSKHDLLDREHVIQVCKYKQMFLQGSSEPKKKLWNEIQRSAV